MVYTDVPAQKLHMSFSEGRHNENCLIQEGALLLRKQAVVAVIQYQETRFFDR